MHIVFTEKRRKDISDHKDMRATNYTYYNSCFLILLLIKSRLGTFPPFRNLFTLFINIKTKDKTICSIHIDKIKVKIYRE